VSRLRATLIDVGSGDSIFLESEDQNGKISYGLIDSNDTATTPSSYIFLKRFFQRKKKTVPASQRLFDWVLLTHAHADHSQGLKRILKDFRTRRFWYAKATKNCGVHYTNLIRFAKRSSAVKAMDVVDDKRNLPKFGDVQMSILWPQRGTVSSNENDNSVVLELTLGSITFVMTGDAEADVVWNSPAASLSANTQVFKVPHHGADNGTFDSRGNTPWLSALPTGAKVAISCHIEPHQHPASTVIAALNSRSVETFRTDEQFHVTFETTGQSVDVSYTHV
jgi:competence protein ComEC